MKKLFIFLFLIPLISAAQTTKTVDIFTNGNCKVSCMETLILDSLVSAYVIFEAKDDRLPTLTNNFTICYDTPQNVFQFLSEIEKFIADDSTTSTEIRNHKVEIEKIKGSKEVKVYDERGLIFHRFSPKIITGIKTDLSEWAVKNNIELE